MGSFQEKPQVLHRAVTPSADHLIAYPWTWDLQLEKPWGAGQNWREWWTEGDRPWLTWFLLSPHPHPYRHIVMVFGSVLGRASGAPGISSSLSGVSPLPRSSGRSSSLPPCFQEPRNVNLLVPVLSPSGLQRRIHSKNAVLMEGGRDEGGRVTSPLPSVAMEVCGCGGDLDGDTLLFSSPPSLPAPSNILLCTRAFPESLEIRKTSCQSLLPVSPCSLHPDDREGPTGYLGVLPPSVTDSGSACARVSAHALLHHFSQGSVFPLPSVFPEHLQSLWHTSQCFRSHRAH